MFSQHLTELELFQDVYPDAHTNISTYHPLAGERGRCTISHPDGGAPNNPPKKHSTRNLQWLKTLSHWTLVNLESGTDTIMVEESFMGNLTKVLGSINLSSQS